MPFPQVGELAHAHGNGALVLRFAHVADVSPLPAAVLGKRGPVVQGEPDGTFVVGGTYIPSRAGPGLAQPHIQTPRWLLPLLLEGGLDCSGSPPSSDYSFPLASWCASARAMLVAAHLRALHHAADGAKLPVGDRRAYFVSFATHANEDALKRTTLEASQTGAFSAVHGFSVANVEPEYVASHGGAVSRASWVPHLLRRYIAGSEMRDGDVLQFATAGSAILATPSRYLDAAGKRGAHTSRLCAAKCVHAPASNGVVIFEAKVRGSLLLHQQQMLHHITSLVVGRYGALFMRRDIRDGGLANWTKGSVFRELDMDHGAYGSLPPVLDSAFTLRKDPMTFYFLAQWERCLEDSRIGTADDVPGSPNMQGFWRHKGAASVASALIYKLVLRVTADDDVTVTAPPYIRVPKVRW